MEPLSRSKITTAILVVVAAWLAILAITAGVRRYTSEAELKQISTRIDEAKKENARLSDELVRMKDPQWLALLARQRLNYTFPDESVVFVYKTEKSDILYQPQASDEEQSRWRVWWEWLRGR